MKGLLELYLQNIGQMGFSSREEVEQKMGRVWTYLNRPKFLQAYQSKNGEVLELRNLKCPNYLPKDYDVKIVYV